MTVIIISGIACVFIILDIVSGILNALKQNELSSSIMREGLFNKVSELLLLCLAILCFYMLQLDPFNTMGIPPDIVYSIAIYIIVMELVSIVENICKINPSLSLSKILLIFNIDKEDAEALQSSQEQDL